MRKLNVVVWADRHLEDIGIVRDYVKRLEGVFAGHDLSVFFGEPPGQDVLARAQVFVCWDLPEKLLRSLTSLEWVQFGSSGINHAMSDALTASNARISTLAGVHAIPMAEHAIALMLAFARKLPDAFSGQAGGNWSRGSIAAEVREVEGSTVGVVGMGSIGIQVASKCRGLGCRIAATRSARADVSLADEWFEKEQVAELAAVSDWLVVCTPYTPRTRHLIDNNVLASAKPGCVLVNVARGQVVDEDSLIEALTGGGQELSGKLGGACLDVFEVEPLPQDSPLWSLPNVIITPHTGGSTPNYAPRSARLVAENLAAFLGGRRMPTEFDRARGY